MLKQGFLTKDVTVQLKQGLGFIVNSNIWIALNASALVMMGGKIIGISPNWNMLGLIFFATLADYNLQNILDNSLQKQGKYFIAFNWQHIIFITSILVVFWLCRDFNYYQLLYLGHLAVISFFYAIPTKILDMPPLREFPFLKIFLITYVWVGATAIFPFWDQMNEPKVWAIAAERAFFIFAITLPFDIRDEKTDLENYLFTIANQLGAKHTKWIAYFCLFCAFLIVVVYLKSLIFPFMLAHVIAALLVYKSNRENDKLFFTGLLDGTMILQAILVYWVCMIGGE